MSSCQSENHLQLVGFMPMDHGFKELWKYPFIQIQMVSERKKKKVMISSRTFNLVRCIPFFCLLRITLCFQFSIKNGQTRSSCSCEFCHSQLISITMTSISSHVQPAHIKHSVEFIFFHKLDCLHRLDNTTPCHDKGRSTVIWCILLFLYSAFIAFVVSPSWSPRYCFFFITLYQIYFPPSWCCWMICLVSFFFSFIF